MKNSTFEFIFIQIKDSDSLKEEHLNKFFEGCKHFLDDKPKATNEKIKPYKIKWNEIIEKYVAIIPKINFRIVFATRARNKKFANHSIELIIDEMNKFLSEKSNSSVFNYKNGDIEIYDQENIFSSFKRIVENNPEDQEIHYHQIMKNISELNNEEKSDYDSFIMLIPFSEILKIVKNNLDHIYLENVRHFITGSNVNSGIKERILNKNEKMDFWIFNNGLTMLSDDIKLVESSKKIIVKNPKIIDGLQSSYSIMNVLNNLTEDEVEKIKDRKIIVKLIMTNDDEIKFDVIKSNNDRNKVSPINFLSMDEEQKFIEKEFIKKNYYYDRISNMYKIKGKDNKEIIKPLELAMAYTTLYLLNPSKVRNSKTSLIKNDSNKNAIFLKPGDKINAYINTYKTMKILDYSINKYSSEINKYIKENTDSNLFLNRKHKFNLMVFITKEVMGGNYNVKNFNKKNYSISSEKVNNELIKKSLIEYNNFLNEYKVKEQDLENFIKTTNNDKKLKEFLSKNK